MSLTVWQIDAAQMTPFYNLATCRGLSAARCSVRYVSSRYLYTELKYPDNITFDQLYFRGIDGDWLMKFPRLRKVLRGLYYPVGNLLLWQKIRTTKPDIIHFQWSRLPRFDKPLISAIQQMNIPVVHTVHDVTPLFEDEALSSLYDIYRQCDGLIVHSDANKATLLDEVAGINGNKVHILPLVESPFPEPDNASRQVARDSLGIADDRFVVLFFGMVKDYKGIDILLETIQLAQQATNTITWLVVGKAGDSTQQAYLDQIARLDSTQVVSDYIPNDAVWQYYRAADTAVFPYRHIFQSAALIAAMGFGLPVIATDVGSFPETVRDNGVIIPKENPQALYDAIRAAQEQWDLSARGQASLDIIEGYHRYDKVGAALRAIYETMRR